MGRKPDAMYCMGELWQHNVHRYSIALTHVIAPELVWK